MIRGREVVLAASFALYLLVQMFGWHLPAWPNGELYFNPLAWQFLFVFGAWYSEEGAGRLKKIVQSRAALALALLYLVLSLAIALTWQIKPLEGFIPNAVSKLIYPIDKSHLAPVRLLHFLALAIVVSRLTPPDWRGLSNPWLTAMIRCGENSLAISERIHRARRAMEPGRRLGQGHGAGAQGLAIRVAKSINRALHRKGKVWAARHERHDLRTLRQVRNCLVYVLFNHRKHARA